MASVVLPLIALALPGTAYSETLRVGQGEQYSTPCEAISAAQEGDIIEISALQEYKGNVCSWSKSGLTLRGIEGKARIQAGDQSASDQGIWVIDGDNTSIENLDLSGAFASDGQGAAIRLNGRNLTIKNSTFHHNQNGVVVMDSEEDNSVLIEHVEFGHNQTNNLSVGKISKLTVRFSYSHHSGGNLISSKALRSDLHYNRFTAEEGATLDEVALPSGGKASLIGNVIQKGAASVNRSLVSFLTDGLELHDASELQVVNNTFVSDYSEEVVFVDIAPESELKVVIRNNIFSGAGRVSGYEGAVLEGNLAGVDPVFLNPAEHDYRLHDVSAAVDAGSTSEDTAGADSAAAYSPTHPGCIVSREVEGQIDAGAFELGAPDCTEPFVENLPEGKVSEKRTAAAILSSITLNPSSPAGGAWTTSNYVNLSSAAPSGGALVTILSSNSLVASVPTSIMIPAGATSQRFTIKTKLVSSTTPITIRASYAGGTISNTLTVSSVALSSLSLNPSTFGGGLTTVSNKIILNGPAPAGGVSVALSSSDYSIVRPPSSITVSAGVTTAVFSMTSSVMATTKTAVITANLKGNNKTALVTVNPVGLETVWTSPTTIVSGSPACILRIKLSGPAPSSGAAVSIASANSLVATAPATITVKPGAVEAYAYLSIKSVDVTSKAVFTGTYKGGSRSTTLTVLPISVHSLTLSPRSTVGGTTTSSNYVRLSGKAAAGGELVTLRSSDTAAATVPASVMVPAGSTMGYFKITTRDVSSSKAVTISAILQGTKTNTLTVLP